LVKSKRILDERFKTYWKNYVFQPCAATIVILLVHLLFHMNDLVIMASIGASTFIVFAMPKYPTARARNLIGGHSIALAVGALLSITPDASFISDVIIDALAVGLSIFLMALTQTEHPPAASTTLGVVVAGISMDIVSAVLIGTVLLSLIHLLFKKHLRNLI
jgi:CBS-domain-containing membrane protein